jgi:hypothetical protein
MAGSTGVDRRTLIKGAIAAGAAAWTAPVIVDSLASPAAAASGTTGIGCSWVYVFFRKSAADSTVYYTGFAKNGVGCGNGSSNNATPICLPCGGANYTIGTFGGGEGGSVGELTYGNGSCTPGTALPNAATHLDSSSCGSYVTASGGVITPVGSAILLAAIGHPSATLSGWCPNSGANIDTTINGTSGGNQNCPAL